jgi:drug/metabolite transporter (DMT)-like permease
MAALLTVLAMFAWSALAYLVFNGNPDEFLAHLAFYLLLFLALMSTVSVGAYALSFRLFQEKFYQGNVAHSLQQGVLLASLATFALLLQEKRSFTPLAGIILIAAYFLLEILLLRRSLME